MKDDICKTLKKLENNNIKYAILRDYLPISSLNTSKDIDILVSPNDNHKLDQLMKNEGWYAQKINCGRYPHKQYFKISTTGIKKLDFVFGLYYGQTLLQYNQTTEVLDRRIKIDDIYVLSLNDTFITFLLHIFFDKGMLSEHNKVILDKLITRYDDNNLEKEDYFYKLATEIVKTKNIDSFIKERKNEIQQKCELKSNLFLHIYKRVTFIIKNIFALTIHRISNKSIAFIGVDGSGKTTTTHMINDIISDKSVVQYLGFKNYEIKFVKKHFEHEKNNFIYKINSLLFQYIDLLYRYYKNRFSKRIVIFDRFPWEAPINYHGLSKIITFIQYKILFPRPKVVYYIYCDMNTSLERKDDIIDVESFKNMKRNFDKKFLNNKKIKSYSTSTLTPEDIKQKIIEDINSRFVKYIVF